MLHQSVADVMWAERGDRHKGQEHQINGNRARRRDVGRHVQTDKAVQARLSQQTYRVGDSGLDVIREGKFSTCGGPCKTFSTDLLRGQRGGRDMGRQGHYDAVDHARPSQQISVARA